MALPSRRTANWLEELRETSPLFRSNPGSSGKSSGKMIPRIIPWMLVVVLAGVLLFQQKPSGVDTATLLTGGVANQGKIFVSYSYFEKDNIQVRS